MTDSLGECGAFLDYVFSATDATGNQVVSTGVASGMRILLIGATGTIGSAVATALGSSHEVIQASHTKAAEHVDISDSASLSALFERVGAVDAIVSAAGSAAWKPFAELADGDYAFSLRNKLMGQANIVRLGAKVVRDGGSITVTSGVLAQQAMQGAAAVSMVNAGLEGFVRVAALELAPRVRVNVVSPPWVSETLTAMGMDPSPGTPAAEVAKSYVTSVEGEMTGQTLAA